MSKMLAVPFPAGRDRRPVVSRLLLIVSAVAFSTSGVFTREASADVWTTIFWRNLSGSAALLPFLLLSAAGPSLRLQSLRRRSGWTTMAASCLATVCFVAALTRTSVANVSIIYGAAPLMTAVLAWLWLGEAISATTLCASALALGGVIVTVAGSWGGGTLTGDGLALSMTFAMALMTVSARRHPSMAALPLACVTSLVTAAAVLPLGWIAGADFAISWTTAAWLAGFGIASMAIALPCYFQGAAGVPAAEAMLISVAELPLAPLWVWLAFAEVPRRASVIGGAIVAAAVVWPLVRPCRP